MRIFLLATALCLSLLSAQAQIAGQRIEGPVTIGSYTLNTGDTLHLGKGSTQYGSFAFVFQPPNVLIGVAQQNMPAQYAGQFVVIKHFKRTSSRRTGEKVLIIVNPFGVMNYVVDLLPGIQTGEVVAINRDYLQPVSSAAPVSVADELLKLKQLLDAGAITSAEYEAQKKKLLKP